MSAPTVTTIQVAGGNLFAIAAQFLGDSSQWNRIAALNGLTDPMLSGVTTLKIPPVNKAAGNGGILGQ
jgi:nucleoid-associated protein YgaU